MITGRHVQLIAATAALLLQLALIVFGVVRTDTVARINNIFPFADKVWHGVYYALLAALLWQATGRRWAVASLLLASFAIADEAIQALTPGRSASALDLLIDVGVGLGAIAAARAISRTHS